MLHNQFEYTKKTEGSLNYPPFNNKNIYCCNSFADD